MSMPEPISPVPSGTWASGLPDRTGRRFTGRIGKFTLRPFDRLSAPQPPLPSTPAGFTLLEAIVALTIFSAGALSLYGLFNANLVSLQRVRDVALHMPAAHQAVAHLAALNPRQREEGRVEFDDYAVVWSARLLEPVRQGQSVSGRRGDYEIGLYRVAFTLSQHDRPIGTYRLRLVGYEKVRKSGGFSSESENPLL